LHPGAPLIPRRFFVTSSGRVSAHAPDTKTNQDLVLLLAHTLNAEYCVGFSPGEKSARTTADCEQAKENTAKTLILYGNSNIRQTAPALQALGFTVVDRTGIRWDGSDGALREIQLDSMRFTASTELVFVFDFLGPIPYRFEQSDGSLAMPIRIGDTGFHLLGAAAVAEDSTIRKTILRLEPLLKTMSTSATVLIPPLPRFVFGGCCRDPSHANGSGSGDSPKKMITSLARIRKLAKTEIQKMGLGNYWLADPLSALSGSADPLAELKNLSAKDNVHFTAPGYSKLANMISDAVEKVGGRNNMARKKEVRYYWRGFSSPRGAARPPASSAGSAGPSQHGRSRPSGPGAGMRAHPYKRQSL